MEPNFDCLPCWSKAGCLSEVDMGILPTRLKGGYVDRVFRLHGDKIAEMLGDGKYMASAIS